MPIKVNQSEESSLNISAISLVNISSWQRNEYVQGSRYRSLIIDDNDIETNSSQKKKKN
jgi:hypothetical protein